MPLPKLKNYTTSIPAGRSVGEIQKKHGDLMSGYGKDVSATVLMLGLAEEVGEIARIGLKTEQGIRGFDKPLDENPELMMEIGDLVMFLCHLCNKLNISLEKCIYVAFGKVLQRHERQAEDGTNREASSS